MSPAYSEGRPGTARRTGSVWPSTISTNAGCLHVKSRSKGISSSFGLLKEQYCQLYYAGNAVFLNLCICRLSQKEFFELSLLHSMPVKFRFTLENSQYSQWHIICILIICKVIFCCLCDIFLVSRNGLCRNSSRVMNCKERVIFQIKKTISWILLTVGYSYPEILQSTPRN